MQAEELRRIDVAAVWVDDLPAARLVRTPQGVRFTYLDGYTGARLPREIVRGTQVAVSAGAGYDGIGRGPSLFYMDGSPADGKTVADLEAALRA